VLVLRQRHLRIMTSKLHNIAERCSAHGSCDAASLAWEGSSGRFSLWFSQPAIHLSLAMSARNSNFSTSSVLFTTTFLSVLSSAGAGGSKAYMSTSSSLLVPASGSPIEGFRVWLQGAAPALTSKIKWLQAFGSLNSLSNLFMVFVILS